MNGRVFDPTLGRFLSADPNVDGAYDSQGYNRYSYVGNNPLNRTDPSGFFSLKDVGMIVAIAVVAVVTAGAALVAVGAMCGQYFSMAVALQALAGVAGAPALTAFGAVVAGAGAGFGSAFAGSLLNGGSVGDAFKAGAIGAVVGGVAGGLTYGIGSAFPGQNQTFERMLAHGVVEGGVSEASEGQFRHGFYAGFFTAGASPFVSKGYVGAVESAVVGGTASVIGGGKFANGAVSGAFQYLLNEAQHRIGDIQITESRVEVSSVLDDETRPFLNAGSKMIDGVSALNDATSLLEGNPTAILKTLMLDKTIATLRGGDETDLAQTAVKNISKIADAIPPYTVKTSFTYRMWIGETDGIQFFGKKLFQRDVWVDRTQYKNVKVPGQFQFASDALRAGQQQIMRQFAAMRRESELYGSLNKYK